MTEINFRIRKERKQIIKKISILLKDKMKRKLFTTESAFSIGIRSQQKSQQKPGV